MASRWHYEDPEPLLQHLMQKSIAAGECLIWTGKINYRGYAIFTIEGKKWKLHRLAYMMRHGIIPQGAVIRHTCGQKNCWNVDHLYVDRVRDDAA